MILDYAFEQPGFYAVLVSVVILSIVLHELGHALVASWEGDPTPKIRGHLTWKPWVHMGWLSIILCATIGIAWGMTPVTRSNFRHRRWGDVLVSFAGPAVNLGLAALGAVMLTVIQRSGASAPSQAGHVNWIALFWLMMLWRNCALFVLNMIPVPPLDGFRIVDGTFDLGQLGDSLRRSGNIGLLVLIVVLNIPHSPFYSAVDGLMRGLARVAGASIGAL